MLVRRRCTHCRRSERLLWREPGCAVRSWSPIEESSFSRAVISATTAGEYLEDENRRLKQMVAEQALDIQALKGVLAKKF